MAPCLLVWALPGEWDQRDLDDPDAEERLMNDLRKRWSSYNLDATAETTLIEDPINAARFALLNGTLLWAIRSQGEGTEESPLSTISLSIALCDLLSDDVFGDRNTFSSSSGSPSALRKIARPLPVGRDMTAFTVERHVPIDERVATLSMYNAQIFVRPASLPLLAVVSVATLDPAREAEARDAAGFVARSIHFLPVEDS